MIGEPLDKVNFMKCYFLAEALPLQFPQQNPTVTFFLAGLPEKGHFVKSPLALASVPFTSLAAFLAQLPQHTPSCTVCALSMALPEIGHLSFTAAAPFLGPA